MLRNSPIIVGHRFDGRQEQVAGVLARIFINKNVVERFLGKQQAGEEKLRKWTSKEQQRKKKSKIRKKKGLKLEIKGRRIWTLPSKMLPPPNVGGRVSALLGNRWKIDLTDGEEKRKDASRLGQGKETLGQGWEAEATSYLFGRPGSLGRLPVQTSRISFISGRHQVVCPGRIIDLLVPFPP